MIALAREEVKTQDVSARISGLLVLARQRGLDGAEAARELTRVVLKASRHRPGLIGDLRELDTHDGPVAGVLLDELQADGYESRLLALRGVAASGVQDAALNQAVDDLVSDEDQPIELRQRAAIALASISPEQAAERVDVLIELSLEMENEMRESLLRRRVPGVGSASMEWAMQNIDRGSRQPSMRYRSLQDIGPEAAAAVPRLVQLLADLPSMGEDEIRDSDVRIAMETLAAIGPAAREALPVLRLYARATPPLDHPYPDRYTRWRDTAARAIAAIEADE